MIRKLLSIATMVGLGLGATAQVSTFPWSEDFESENQCSTSCGVSCSLQGEFTNDTGDDIDWASDAFGTGSSSTGPTANGGADHNPGTSGGKYLYTEASGCYFDVANLVSPDFDFSGVGTPVLSFWWHMYGGQIGTMHFDIDTNGVWQNDYIPSWTDNTDQWQEEIIDLSEFAGMSSFRFRIRGITGSSFGSDMAVDDFLMINAEYNVGLVDGNLVPCFNESNGFLDVIATYGVAPYTYAWSTGATGTFVDSLAPGMYTVTATDANGDTTSSTFNLAGTTPIVANPAVTTPLICKYDVAEVSANGSGGEPAQGSYSWDTTSANYAPDTSMAGTTVVLSDDQVSSTLNIGFDFEFFGVSYNTFTISSNGFMTLTPNTLSGCCSGQLFPSTTSPNAVIALCWDDLYPPGNGTISYYTIGTAPFRTLIVNFDQIPYCCNSTPSVSVQAKLFETTNCLEIHTVDVNNASPATQGIENETGTEGYAYPGRNSSAWSGEGDFIGFCPIDSTGLVYEWSDGYLGQVNSGLSAGTYDITITDAQGCSVVETVTVDPAPSNLTLDPLVSDVSCFGFNDASVNSNQTGGVAPISYAWSSGQTTADINNLGGGTFSVVATDNLGCVDSVSGIMVEEPALLISTIYQQSSPICPDDETGSASATASGGREPYTYAWSDGQVNAMASNLSAGSYQVSVTDSSGCESVQAVNIIAEESAPVVDLGVNQQSFNGIGVTLTAGNYPSIIWSTGETTQSIVAGQTGTYWATATNAAGCSGSDTTFVTIWPNGINEKDGSSLLSLFPNPTKDKLTLDLAGGATLESVAVNVVDVQGRTVLTEQFQSIAPNQPVTLDVNGLPAGAYTLSITSGDVTIDRVFVKQ